MIHEVSEPIDFICEVCGAEPTEESVVDWFIRLENYQGAGLVCPACFAAAPNTEHLAPMKQFMKLHEARPPLRGNFTAVKTDAEIVHLRTDAFYGPFWLELEQDMLEELARFGAKILRFTFPGPENQGIKIVPVWEANHVIGLAVAGDTPAKKLKLDIYQTHRLKQMGFSVEGAQEQIWRLSLQPEEQDLSNVVRIITHVMEFGYMMRPQRIPGFTPVIDIDIAEERRNAAER